VRVRMREPGQGLLGVGIADGYLGNGAGTDLGVDPPTLVIYFFLSIL